MIRMRTLSVALLSYNLCNKCLLLKLYAIFLYLSSLYKVRMGHHCEEFEMHLRRAHPGS